MTILKLISSDLHMAGSLSKEKQINYFDLLKYLVYKHARVATLVRLRVSTRGITKTIASFFLKFFYKIEIGENVKIGKCFFLPHPQCIIISSGVVFGEFNSVAQYATIGGNQKKVREVGSMVQRVPILGDRVWIGPGSVIGGPVVLGDDVLVGANSVVTHDVKKNSLVYGQNQKSKKRVEVLPFEGTYRVIE